jgi:hypothetical protein
MARQPLFAGLIVDEFDAPVEVTLVGNEAFYVVDDDGFLRHIDSEFVDRQVLDQLLELIEGHEELISEGTMKMIGQEDIFTKAMIEAQLKNMDDQFEALLEQGIPEDAPTWLGMLGFRVVINLHGEVLQVDQPGMHDDDPRD